MGRRWSSLAVAGASLVAFGCANDTSAPNAATKPQFATSAANQVAVAYLKNVNDRLAARGLNVRVQRLEYSLASNGNPNTETTVFANDRELRLTSRWVPGDPNRHAGNFISYAYFLPLRFANSGDATPIDSKPSVDASFATWNAQTCSNLPLQQVALAPNNFPSLILSVPGFDSDFLAADIKTIGFLPGDIFDAVLGPGAKESVLGVTFTFIWGDNTPDGFVPSDMDNNGRNDTAHKEVWYNDDFAWTSTGAADKIDIETVALHENGHALELGHFGRVAVTNGRLVVSPRSVMNAFVLGTLRAPLGTDNAAYCGNWAKWPN